MALARCILGNFLGVVTPMFNVLQQYHKGWDSSVGTATGYGLDGPGIGEKIPVGAIFFAHVQTGPRANPAPCAMGTGSFPGVKRPGCGADHPSSDEIENE
jgi:hypothetical protein